MKQSTEHLCISRETAEEYVNTWKDGGYTILPSTNLEENDPTQLGLDAFVFSIDDFTQFVERVKCDPLRHLITGVVCRLGIKNNPVGQHPPKVPCLIFEAVTGFDPTAPVPVPGEALGDLVAGDFDPHDPIERITARYDFSYPCPPTCPVIAPHG